MKTSFMSFSRNLVLIWAFSRFFCIFHTYINKKRKWSRGIWAFPILWHGDENYSFHYYFVNCIKQINILSNQLYLWVLTKQLKTKWKSLKYFLVATSSFLTFSDWKKELSFLESRTSVRIILFLFVTKPISIIFWKCIFITIFLFWNIDLAAPDLFPSLV